MALVVHWGKCGLVSDNARLPFWQSAILASELKKPLPFCHATPVILASRWYYLVLLFWYNFVIFQP